MNLFTRTKRLGALLVAFGSVSVAGFAHPGHGSKVVWGTLKEVARDAIVVEARDTASGTVNRVRILLQPDTRFRIDKEPLPSLDGMVGQRAIASVDWEDDDRGGLTLRATEVRFSRPKTMVQIACPLPVWVAVHPLGGLPTAALSKLATSPAMAMRIAAVNEGDAFMRTFDPSPC